MTRMALPRIQVAITPSAQAFGLRKMTAAIDASASVMTALFLTR